MNMHVYGQVEWHTALMTDCVTYYSRGQAEWCEHAQGQYQARWVQHRFNHCRLREHSGACPGGEVGAMLCIKVGVRFALHHF